METNLLLNEYFNNKYDLLKYHQAKTEYLLVLILGYLWNTNLDKLSTSEKLNIYSIISKKNLTIGTIIKLIQDLDKTADIISDAKILEIFENYRNTRNEEIGHGFTFDDATEGLVNSFESFYKDLCLIKNPIITKEIDFIIIKQEDKDFYRGIKYKADSTIDTWYISKNSYQFNINELYIQFNNNGNLEYFRISPFIQIDRIGTNTDFYIFCKIDDTRSGKAIYNLISRTGKKEIEWNDFKNLNKVTDQNFSVGKNGTIMNKFQQNYDNFISVGTKRNEVKNFILKHPSNTLANIWGQGGVGKTATIQRICVELIEDSEKHFDCIIFLSAKNTKFNTETGRVQNIDFEEKVEDYESLIKTINYVAFENAVFDEDKIKNYNSGKLLIVIDDFESFSKTDQSKIINFFGVLNIQYYKVIITTRLIKEIAGSWLIPINEFDINDTRTFLLELIKADKNIVSSKKELIEKELKNKQNLQRLHFITDGRPIFIEYFAKIIGREDFVKSLAYDIKSTPDAINFLFGKIYDNLSSVAQDIFVAIGQLKLADDLSNFIPHLRYIANKEADDDTDKFIDGLEELKKYKIIQVDDDKTFFKVWVKEIIKPIQLAFSKRTDTDFKSVVSKRANQVSKEKNIDVEQALLQDAEQKRISARPENEIVSAFKQVINRKSSSDEIKLKAIFSLATYYTVQSIPPNFKSAINLYEDYESKFLDNAVFVERYAYLCYGFKDKKFRAKSIDLLLNFIHNKQKKTINQGVKMKFYGLIIMRRYMFLQENLESQKNNTLIGKITKEDFEKRFIEFNHQLNNIYAMQGNLLFKEIQEYTIGRLTKSEKHYIFNGLYLLVDICVKIQQIQTAHNICTFVIQNAPEPYNEQFSNYLNRLPKHIEKNTKQINHTAHVNSKSNVVNCIVDEITERTVLVYLEEIKQQAILHISEVSSKFVSNLTEIFSKSSKFKAILKDEKIGNKLVISLKEYEQELNEGQIVNCKVVYIKEKSAICLIPDYYLLAEIYVRDIANEFVSNINEYLKIGDMKFAEIISVSKKFGISLSIKNISQDEQDHYSDLGIILKKAIQNDNTANI